MFSSTPRKVIYPLPLLIQALQLFCLLLSLECVPVSSFLSLSLYSLYWAVKLACTLAAVCSPSILIKEREGTGQCGYLWRRWQLCSPQHRSYRDCRNPESDIVLGGHAIRGRNTLSPPGAAAVEPDSTEQLKKLREVNNDEAHREQGLTAETRR